MRDISMFDHLKGLSLKELKKDSRTGVLLSNLQNC